MPGVLPAPPPVALTLADHTVVWAVVAACSLLQTFLTSDMQFHDLKAHAIAAKRPTFVLGIGTSAEEKAPPPRGVV